MNEGREAGKRTKKSTCGEAHQLMTLGKWHIKIGYKSMDIVITFCHKLKRSSEGSIPRSHLGDIHRLNEGHQISSHYPKSKVTASCGQNQFIFFGWTCPVVPTLSSWQLVTIWFWSTVSTRGSLNACFLMQLMLKPYTLFQTGKNEIGMGKK